MPGTMSVLCLRTRSAMSTLGTSALVLTSAMAPACGSRQVSAAAEAGHPVAGNRQVVRAGWPACARSTARGSAGSTAIRAMPIGHLVRADRQVVVLRPALGDELLSAPTIQPTRTPGIPYAFDRPLVTITRSLMPQKLFVRGRSISAPR